ncbi:MAG: FliH/SctL family protein [Acetatifactor sp.]
MSNNIVKQYFAVVRSEEKRIIDTNELARRRIRERLGDTNCGTEGFVSGLEAEELVAADGDEIREEAGAGTVIKAGQDAGQLLEQARKEAAALLEDANAQARKITEEAEKLMEAEKSRVLSEAREKGYNDGLVKAREEAEAAMRECREKERQLETFYQQQIEEMEPKLVDAITDIYQHIFHVELGSYKDVLLNLIEAALKGSEGGRNFLIHVSREDYPYISERKEQVLSEAVSSRCEVDVVEDMTLEPNQCLIETDSGMIDCGLGTQLEELKQKLRLLARTKEE